MSAARRGSSTLTRFRGSFACPVCGGTEDDDRGTGKRCHGFMLDGKYAHCTREELGGGCDYNAEGETYAHLLKGKCKCGVEHNPTDEPPRPPRISRGRSRGEPTAAYDYRDESGTLLFQALRYVEDGGKKTFIQRRPNGTGGWEWSTKGVRTLLYRLPELLAADPAAPVFIVEGEKDVDRLRSLGLVATCNPMGAGKWRADYAKSLAGRTCYVIPDHDDTGRDHADKVVRSVVRVAATVKIIDLADLCREHGLADLPEKGDASDYLDLGGTADGLKQAFHDAPPWSALRVHKPADDDRPEIVCGYENSDEGLKRWTPLAVEALDRVNKAEPTIFQKNGALVRLNRPATADDVLTLEVLDVDSLRGVLDRAASWANMIETRKGPQKRYGSPRLEIVRDLLALDGYDPAVFPPIDLIADAPLFAADGHLIVEPGFHRDSGVYYAPSPELAGLTIPEQPTPADVADAVGLIFDELLVDFPFRNPASRANALALMLLPFARLMIAGPSPNHHCTASTEGSGKGLLAAACCWAFLGREVDINVQKESEAEWRKALTSFFMSGASHFFLDNMYNPVGWDESPRDVDSGTLAAAWTGRRWKDRILGGQEEARIKVSAVFMSSGNNVTFSRELTRRLVHIQLVAVSENPSLRTGFRHDELLVWAAENRAALTRACLVLVRNWVARGRKPGRATMGSYESYAKTMSGILEAAGVSGFLENRPKPKAGRDRESLRWPQLVEAWHRERGTMATSTGQLYDMVFGEPGDRELSVSFADIVGEGKELGRKQKFGHAIGKQDGRVWGEWRIARSSQVSRSGVPLYRLIDPEEAFSSGDEDDAWEESRE